MPLAPSAPDVLVIGAGQAGLATYQALRGARLRVLLVDGAARIGDAWRRRPDSLRLFSPRALSALPGLALPGDPEGYPTKDELADYLEAYARAIGAPARLRTPIRRLEPFPGTHLALRRLRRAGIRVAGRVRGARGRTALLDGAGPVEVDAVVWAVGYRDRTGWVDVPGAIDAGGRFLERGGISPVPRLYFVGRDWQRSRGSALLAGVARDAAFVVRALVDALVEPGGLRRGAFATP